MLMIASSLPADASATLAQACAQRTEITFSAAASRSEIQQFLAADSSSRVLIFIEFAADHLARVIHAGPEKLAAQAECWQQNAEAVLDLYEHNPTRLHLVSFQAARHTPQALSSSFGIELSLPGIPASDCLFSLLASHWLNDQDTLAALDRRLRASSSCNGEASWLSDSALAAAQLSAAQSAQLALYREENGVLLRQLHLAQEELARRPQQTPAHNHSCLKTLRSISQAVLHRYKVSRHRDKFRGLERIARALLSSARRLARRVLRK